MFAINSLIQAYCSSSNNKTAWQKKADKCTLLIDGVLALSLFLLASYKSLFPDFLANMPVFVVGGTLLVAVDLIALASNFRFPQQNLAPPIKIINSSPGTETPALQSSTLPLNIDEEPEKSDASNATRAAEQASSPLSADAPRSECWLLTDSNNVVYTSSPEALQQVVHCPSSHLPIEEAGQPASSPSPEQVVSSALSSSQTLAPTPTAADPNEAASALPSTLRTPLATHTPLPPQALSPNSAQGTPSSSTASPSMAKTPPSLSTPDLVDNLAVTSASIGSQDEPNAGFWAVFNQAYDVISLAYLQVNPSAENIAKIKELATRFAKENYHQTGKSATHLMVEQNCHTAIYKAFFITVYEERTKGLKNKLNEADLSWAFDKFYSSHPPTNGWPKSVLPAKDYIEDIQWAVTMAVNASQNWRRFTSKIACKKPLDVLSDTLSGPIKKENPLIKTLKRLN